MGQPRKPKEESDIEEEINARMEQALKRALTTPHKTDKEIVDARRRQGMRQSGKTMKK